MGQWAFKEKKKYKLRDTKSTQFLKQDLADAIETAIHIPIKLRTKKYEEGKLTQK